MAAPPSPTDPIDWIESAATRDPDRVWLETPDGPIISYQILHRSVAAMAGRLTGLGINPGDRVATQLEKSPQAVILYFACLWVGAVYMPLNPGYTNAEIDYFLTDAEPALFVVETPGEFANQITLAALTARAAGMIGPRPRFASDALAAMLYTSGTTGKPKGAMLTRANLASNAVALAQAWQMTKADILIHALPIFHVHGLFIAVNSITAAGARMLFLPRFETAAVIDAMPRASLLMGVPTFYTRLLADDRLTRATSASMRLFVSGSAPLLAPTHRAFEARTGHAILERYGMTETGINSANPYDGARIAGTVGPPLAGVELRISDATEGVGMIEVRGPNVFAGYWRNPEKTAAEFHDGGWFITGDLGKIDEHGYLHIIGRGKDLIISGGFNVYPIEVEDEIDALPGVRESAVIGVAHPDFGEAVVAVVVGEAGAALDPVEMLESLRTRLAAYKLPKAIHIVSELPRNAMGKVQKTVLRGTWG